MTEKNWWEESPQEFADGFTEEVQVHHSSTESESKPVVGNKEAQFEAIYGPEPRFSEFRVGERIRYRSGAGTSTGVIVWVCSPQIVVGKQEPTQYVVENDAHAGFPDVIPQSDIIQ